MFNLDSQPRLWTSLLLTAFFSFVTPAGFVLCLWFGVYLIGQIIPPLAPFTGFAADQVQGFLVIFGGGNLWQGVLIIGTVGAFVGVLFDTYVLSFSRSNLAKSHLME